jgi:hypothetical protein
MTTPVAAVRATALAAHAAGICVVPPREDGSKRPIGKWEQYQKKPPEVAQLDRWYGICAGVGFVCGRVSGGLELFEFDDAETYGHFMQAAEALGLRDLVDEIENGYCETTPSGGVHWLYRVPTVPGNTKLAQRPGPPDPNTGHPTREVLIETRGEGGYVIVAPSGGNVHRSHKEYRLTSGSVATIAGITYEERDSLWDLARTFDEIPKPPPVEKPAKAKGGNTHSGGWIVEPGKAYADEHSWEDILEPRGWVKVYTRDDTTYWRRPGKDEGVSATTNHNGSDCLHVFSSSTDLEPNTSYSKFGVYAHWHHGGDFSAAAKALHEERGYGTPAGSTKASGQANSSKPEAPKEWGPVRLGREVEVESFPLNVLPPELARLAQEIGDAVGIDVGMPALGIIAIASGLIGAADSLRIEHNRFASSTIYAGIVGMPGDGKTPALEYVAKPAYEIEHELDGEFREAKERYLQDLRDYDQASRKKAPPGTSTPKPDKPNPPIPRRAVYGTGTTEAWIRCWACPGNEKGGVVVNDELGVLVDGFNQYKSKGNDKQILLQSWSNQPISLDRVTNEFMAPIRVQHPHVSIVGNLTPSSLKSFFASNGEDGFRDRWLLYFPDRRPKLKSPDRFPVSDSALEAWRDAARRLWRRASVTDPHTGRSYPTTIHFTHEAKALFDEFADAQIDETSDPDFDTDLLGLWSKLDVYASRFCLVLALLHWAADPTLEISQTPACSVEIVHHAWRLVACFKTHARRVLAYVQGQGVAGIPRGARLILNWIRAHPEANEITFRDITKAYPARDYPRALMEDGVAWLVRRNVLRAATAPKPETPVRGRPPGPAWEINPEFVETLCVQPIQQYQQNESPNQADTHQAPDSAVNAVLAVPIESEESPEEGAWIV